jgi:hypothetical protein
MRLRSLVLLWSLAAAGCAVERTTSTTSPATPVAPVVSTPAQDSTEPVAAAPVANKALTPPPDRTLVTPQRAAPVQALQPVRQDTAIAPTGVDDSAAVTAARPAEAPVAPADALDFASLGARLRATKAMGVLTKLSVKSQADDLLEQFRDYYRQRGTATLADLRRSYDSLVLKLLSLVHDGDPPLATDIDRSRAAIWDVLSDQRKFIESNLMAASP